MSQSSPPAERPSALRFLPNFLFRPEDPKPAYVLKAWLLALIPSIALSVTVSAALPSAEGPDLPISGPIMIALITLIGPFLETLIMAAVLLGLRLFTGPVPAVLLSSIGWGLAHSWGAPTWGLVAWWPFLIFSIVFLTWRERGFGTAVLIVTAVHALQNSFAVALLLIGGQIAGLH